MTAKPIYEALVQKIKHLEGTIETYRSFINNSPDLIYRTDLEGSITYVSPSVYALSGYTAKEALGMKMAEEIYRFPEERMVFLAKLKQDGQVTNFEARLRRKDGSIWWASTSARFFRDEHGSTAGIEGITRDIDKIKSADKALRESEKRFRLAFHTSPDAINLNRVSDGMYIDINEGFTDLTGYTRDDVIGKTSLDINIWKNPGDRERLVDGLRKKGFVRNLEAVFVKKNGESGIGLMSARILRIGEEDVIQSVTKDISEHKRAQETLVQSEKMMSVGGLAAGMAHEINNPLAGMLQNTEVMLRRLTDTRMPANKTVAEAIGLDMVKLNTFMEKRGILYMADTIKESGSRISKIVDNMLSFARMSTGRVSSHSIAALLDKTIALAGTDFDFKKIKIKKDYGKKIPLIHCESGKLQQVFLNIIHNGAQAMYAAKTSHPCLSIRLWFEQTNKRVCVEIMDNGPGMDTETQKRIFEPFFTTKPVGLGTGLGLSVSYFIITENHGGKISVESEPGHGTTFIVHLPVEAKKRLHN